MVDVKTRDPIKERILEISDCREEAKELGVKLASHAGDNISAHCFNKAAHPDGDRRPSMSIGKKFWQCFACTARGNVIDLYMQFNGWNYLEARNYLAGKKGVERPQGNAQRDGGRPQARTPIPDVRDHTTDKPIVISDLRKEVYSQFWTVVSPLEKLKRGQTLLGSPETEPRLNGYLVERCLVHRDDEASNRSFFEFAQVAVFNDCVNEWNAVLGQYGHEELKSIGFRKELTGDVWLPLVRKKQEINIGFAVPIYHPDYPFPIGYRFRFCDPVPLPDGKKLKSQAMPSTGDNCNSIPLGMQTLKQGNVTKDQLIITEGEIDYLSAMRLFGQEDSRTACLGVCDHGWNDSLTPSLAGMKKILVMMHDTPATRKFLEKLNRSIKKHFGQNHLDKCLLPPAYVSEDYDLNDMLVTAYKQSGSIIPLKKVIEGIFNGWFRGSFTG